MEPIDLAARRSQHRQQLRDESSHVLVVLPSTDGELARSLADLEEVLLLIDLAQVDEDKPLPVPLAEREAADAVGRLASNVATFDRASEETAAQPIAPDGRYELVPLYFVRLGRDDRARIIGAVRELAATRTAASHPAVDEALGDHTGDPQSAERLVAAVERIAALLQLTWDDDVDDLAARLDIGVSADEPRRVVLTSQEYNAYVRVTERILASWHAGDPLERFLYRGV